MKIFEPTQRLQELDLVLKYDTEYSPELKPHERFAINQERAAILRDDNDYWQDQLLESKIKLILKYINATKWQPETKIEYSNKK